MFKWIKDHKKISVTILISLSFFIFIMMPIFINRIFYLNAPFDFFYVDYDISTILNYYSSILTFIGTVSLGCITIYQNHVAQQKTDKVNQLTLELQKKSMAMAEQNYKKSEENIKNSPKFELVNTGSNGNYSNLEICLKNVSDMIASSIQSISFEVFDDNDSIILSSNNVKIKNYSLTSGQDTKVSFNNNPIYSNKIKLVWKFKCDDVYSNVHYYKANLYIEDISNFYIDLWKIEKVG